MNLDVGTISLNNTHKKSNISSSNLAETKLFEGDKGRCPSDSIAPDNETTLRALESKHSP